jgi:hypothetical protein
VVVSEYTGVEVSVDEGETVPVRDWVRLGVCDAVPEAIGVFVVLVIVGVGLVVGVTVIVIVKVSLGLGDGEIVVVSNNSASNHPWVTTGSPS